MEKYLITRESISIQVPKEMTISLLLVGGIHLLQHFSQRYYIQKRKEIYGRIKYMEGFEEDHKIGLGADQKLHPYGDPDNTDGGWYSRKLSYTEWYQLQCAKRAYQEQVEQSPMASILLLIGTLKLPLVSLAFGGFYLIGQFVFSRSYAKNGANTGAKCLGRIATRKSIYILAALAITSSILLIRDFYQKK